jgi:hypothetical protein
MYVKLHGTGFLAEKACNDRKNPSTLKFTTCDHNSSTSKTFTKD